jgi:hypothetical protein
MIRFLRSLLKALNVLTSNCSNDLGAISFDETASRFIFNKKHFSVEKGRVKYAAFLPNINKENGEYETSIFRITGLSESDIWSVGRYVEKLRSQTLRARGDLKVQSIINSGLEVIPETTNHERHANIVNWSTIKNERMKLAIQLEKSSNLYVK